MEFNMGIVHTRNKIIKTILKIPKHFTEN